MRRALLRLFLLLPVLLWFGCAEPAPEATPAADLGLTDSLRHAPRNPLVQFEGHDYPDFAPDFTAPLLQGDSLTLAALRGRVVVLNFWATWCAPCLHETPDLVALHQELSEEGLVVVGISQDADGFESVAAFAERFQVPYPLASDPDGEIAETYGGLYSLPTTFVIDQEGKILHRALGPFPTDRMRPLLRELLTQIQSPSG